MSNRRATPGTHGPLAALLYLNCFDLRCTILSHQPTILSQQEALANSGTSRWHERPEPISSEWSAAWWSSASPDPVQRRHSEDPPRPWAVQPAERLVTCPGPSPGERRWSREVQKHWNADIQGISLCAESEDEYIAMSGWWYSRYLFFFSFILQSLLISVGTVSAFEASLCEEYFPRWGASGKSEPAGPLLNRNIVGQQKGLDKGAGPIPLKAFWQQITCGSWLLLTPLALQNYCAKGRQNCYETGWWIAPSSAKYSERWSFEPADLYPDKLNWVATGWVKIPGDNPPTIDHLEVILNCPSHSEQWAAKAQSVEICTIWK